MGRKFFINIKKNTKMKNMKLNVFFSNHRFENKKKMEATKNPPDIRSAP